MKKIPKFDLSNKKVFNTVFGISTGISLIAAFTLGTLVGPSKEEYENLEEEYDYKYELYLKESETNAILVKEVEALEKENSEMKEELSSEAYLVFKEKADAEIKAEKERLAAEKAAKEKAEAEKAEQERIAAEEKAKQEKLAAEEAERQKYERTIDFAHLNKNADKYAGEPYKFYGQIVQIMESNNYTTIRMSVTQTSYGWSSSDIIYVEYDGTTDFVEDDVITVYGTVFGSHSYTSQAGYNISLPAVIAKQIK